MWFHHCILTNLNMTLGWLRKLADTLLKNESSYLFNLIDSQRTLFSNAAESVFFTSIYKIVTKINNILP